MKLKQPRRRPRTQPSRRHSHRGHAHRGRGLVLERFEERALLAGGLDSTPPATPSSAVHAGAVAEQPLRLTDAGAVPDAVPQMKSVPGEGGSVRLSVSSANASKFYSDFGHRIEAGALTGSTTGTLSADDVDEVWIIDGFDSLFGDVYFLQQIRSSSDSTVQAGGRDWVQLDASSLTSGNYLLDLGYMVHFKAAPEPVVPPLEEIDLTPPSIRRQTGPSVMPLEKNGGGLGPHLPDVKGTDATVPSTFAVQPFSEAVPGEGETVRLATASRSNRMSMVTTEGMAGTTSEPLPRRNSHELASIKKDAQSQIAKTHETASPEFRYASPRSIATYSAGYESEQRVHQRGKITADGPVYVSLASAEVALAMEIGSVDHVQLIGSRSIRANGNESVIEADSVVEPVTANASLRDLPDSQDLTQFVPSQTSAPKLAAGPVLCIVAGVIWTKVQSSPRRATERRSLFRQMRSK